MRCLNNFAPVEGHSSLVRDMSSNAILATNDNDFVAYQKRREIEKKRNAVINSQVQEIQSLKNEIDEIKTMLSKLIANKGQ
jgi:hypothetical protein